MIEFLALKWSITKRRGAEETDSSLLQATKLTLYDSFGKVVPWQTVACSASLPAVDEASSVDNLTDGSNDTKFATAAWGASQTGSCNLLFKWSDHIINFGKYTFTTADDAPDSDPVSWTLSFSRDGGKSWILLDEQADVTDIPTERLTETKKYSVRPYLQPVERFKNQLLITFQDNTWKTAAPDVFSVTDGNTPFYTANTWVVNGANTLRSGAIGHSGTSETTIKAVFNEAGAYEIGYLTSSEGNYDKLGIVVNKTQVVTASGSNESSILRYAGTVTAGNVTVVCRYTKDGSVSRDKDAVGITHILLRGVVPDYAKYYLMTDFEDKVYTITDGEVVEIPTLKRTDLKTRKVFEPYGVMELPSSEQLCCLTKPSLFRWCEDPLPRMQATVSARPMAQIIRAVADMRHETIIGISGITAVFQGNVTVSYSYDDQNYTEATTISEFLETDVIALYEGAVHKMIYFTFVLEDITASLTNFIITYKNPQGV